MLEFSNDRREVGGAITKVRGEAMLIKIQGLGSGSVTGTLGSTRTSSQQPSGVTMRVLTTTVFARSSL